MRYSSSNPAVIPDNLFLNNTTVDVNFDRNIMRLIYMDKCRGTKKQISHGIALLPHLAQYLQITGDMDE